MNPTDFAGPALAMVRAGQQGTARHALSPADVLAGWATEGALVHHRTGLERLDQLTGGGPIFGSRWFVQGAPDAGKTAFVVQLGHEAAQAGIAVGFLAVDEEPGDVLTRLAQRCGWSRGACERRPKHELAEMGETLGALPVRFYDDTWTIESAGADLAVFARTQDTRGMLIVDSVQTVRCALEHASKRELGTTEAVSARARAVRATASAHRLFVLTTSEMGRGAYDGRKGEGVADMAAAKYSGSIEYQARVMLTLKSVSGEADLVELSVTKNKHGRSGEKIYLRLDRGRQSLEAVDYSPPPPAQRSDEDREAEREDRVEAMAAELLEALRVATEKGTTVTGQRNLKALVRGANALKQEAVSRLLVTGQIEGGNGHPFVVRGAGC